MNFLLTVPAATNSPYATNRTSEIRRPRAKNLIICDVNIFAEFFYFLLLITDRYGSRCLVWVEILFGDSLMTIVTALDVLCFH